MIILFYLNTFVLFSFLGFFWESFVYKFLNKNKHSGVLHGPYTLVYGIGFVLILFIYKHLSLNLNFINCLIYYLLFCFCATFCEYVIGYLIKIIFNIDSWDYSYHKYHFGKYICLEYFFLWGLFASLFIFFTYNFWLNLINMINPLFSFIVIFIMFIDLIITYLKSRIL